MLRIEFDQSVAANEQTGPINIEMRLLIASLQEHNSQLKGELARFKRKLEEKQNQLNMWKGRGGGGGGGGDVGQEEEDDENKSVEGEGEVMTNGVHRGLESFAAAPAAACEDEAKKEGDQESSKKRLASAVVLKKRRKSEASLDKDEEGGGAIFRLRSELTEARLMLDMYKTAP